MKPVRNPILQDLHLEQCIEEEFATDRNLLPPEPWAAAVRGEKKRIARWIRGELESGTALSPGVTVDSRKLRFGTRPIELLGVRERVVYRALAKYAMKDLDIPGRTSEEYRRFIRGPLEWAFFDRTTKQATFSLKKLSHVLEADIASYYQFIDHEVLRRELIIQTGDYLATTHLIDALGELTSRSTGIPQLLDASDWISEVYIRAVERDLVRLGWPVWRYNDDFRIACSTYSEALHSLDDITACARKVGLVVSEHKTFPRTASNYLHRYFGRELEEGDDFELPDAGEGDDYTADETEMLEEAKTTLKRLSRAAGDRIDLKNLDVDTTRALRRALNRLRKAEATEALPHIGKLFEFAPALTPQTILYLTAMHDAANPGQTDRIWERLIHDHMNDWQGIWLAYAARVIRICERSETARKWMKGSASSARSHALRAEAYVALAEGGEVEFDELDAALRSAPSAVAPWYLHAMKALAPKASAQLKAISATSPLYRAIIGD